MGKIELDHTGSGGGVTLSSDGTDLLLDGTAIGGGGGSPDLFAENYDGTSTLPSATGANAVAIGTGVGGPANASGFNAIALGVDAQSTGGASVAMAYSTASASYSFAAGGGNSQTYGASGANSAAIGTSSNARGSGSVALGKSAYVDTLGTQAVALGDSYASGSHSLAAAISTNSSSYGATGANSVAIGYQAKAAGSQSFVAGGYANTANNYRSSVLNGTGNTVNSNFGTILGGESNTINSNSNYSIILCGEQNEAGQQYTVASGLRAKTTVRGQWAHSAGHFTAAGDAQSSKYVLRSDTTDATAEALTATNTSGDAINQIILPNNSAYAFHGTIVARQKAGDGTASAAWKVEGLIRREGSAGTTVLVNSATTVLDNTPGWGLALSADTTNGGLKVEATGAASTNIRWVATIHTSEVTYA